MTILLKGFFRSKFTKIYLIIFITMLVAITILFNFITYYSNIITKTYQENTYFLITSERDIYNEISNQKNIIDLEKVILFDYDDENDFLKKADMKWFNLLEPDNDLLVAISNNNEIKLEDNQIALGLSKDVLETFDNIYNLEKQKVSFKISNNIAEFQLEKIYESHLSRILISKKTFEKLLETSKSYSYVCKTSDYSKINSVENSLKDVDGIKDMKFIQSHESEATFNSVKELKDVISTLKYGSWIFVIIFSFLFLIIINGIVKDELEKMNLERMLGYNKLQIKKFLIIKLIALNIGTILLSTITYIFINILIKIYFKTEFNIFDISILLQMFVVLLVVSLSFCSLSNFNKNEII